VWGGGGGERGGGGGGGGAGARRSRPGPGPPRAARRRRRVHRSGPSALTFRAIVRGLPAADAIQGQGGAAAPAGLAVTLVDAELGLELALVAVQVQPR